MLTTDLDGRVALVTGSSSGIGRELLLALAAAGAQVAVHYHSSADAARATAAEAADRGAPATTVVQGDVTAPDEVDAIFDAVEADLGAVDVLVNNVGDFAPKRWDELAYDDWKRVLATNLDGTYLCSKRALPAMREGRYGRIVNLGYASSEKGLVSTTNFPYFVAKAGVVMFTRMLAADTRDDGITVNAISPYVVENSDAFPEDLPRDRPARFEDLEQALVFLVDDGSGYVSGTNVEVHGGWLPEAV